MTLLTHFRGWWGGAETLRLISGESQVPTNNEDIDNDFGAEGSILSRNGNNTWTLVVLTGLKPPGRALKIGILKRMLRAALPLSTEMVIRMNVEPLASTKSELELLQEWKISDELNFNELDIESDSGDAEEQDQESNAASETIQVSYSNDPVPHVLLPEVQQVTGMVRLYKERISGGKSEERGVSNGFFVNVFGRIINLNDPSFGEKNLSHAAWSRFRMTVRADGLDKYLTTNREQFRDHRALKIFPGLSSSSILIKARAAYDSDQHVEMPDGG